MRAHRWLLFASSLSALGWIPYTAAAQEQGDAAPCRERPCAVVVDWTRAGGIVAQAPDRRYGNAAELEDRLKSTLAERGYALHGGTGGQDLRILLIPIVREAMCDELPGTSTDMSCRAIVEIEARVEKPASVSREIDLPSRIRNRCPSNKIMPVDKLADFVADWIIYAVDGRMKGERRPIARC